MYLFKKEPTEQELEGEIRRKRLLQESSDLDFSIAQKREMLARLKAQGVSKSQIGNWRQVWEWLKAH